MQNVDNQIWHVFHPSPPSRESARRTEALPPSPSLPGWLVICAGRAWRGVWSVSGVVGMTAGATRGEGLKIRRATATATAEATRAKA